MGSDHTEAISQRLRLFGRHKPTEPAGAPAQQRSCRDEQHRHSNACAATRSTGRAALVLQSAAPAQKRLGHDTAFTHSRMCNQNNRTDHLTSKHDMPGLLSTGFHYRSIPNEILAVSTLYSIQSLCSSTAPGEHEVSQHSYYVKRHSTWSAYTITSHSLGLSSIPVVKRQASKHLAKVTKRSIDRLSSIVMLQINIKN
ncbi:hypothetical protein B5X24_HaOG204504 [Helicoverpa armigera]|uniref:Uncharacterized protein n=1 Tax=Helicoverpa armigera TaxID=29058 RepID=A0A2W1BS64_HELAM|nr:hypothetical protein B5X24_HaOG204504 [Helicoverpa armigera]